MTIKEFKCLAVAVAFVTFGISSVTAVPIDLSNTNRYLNMIFAATDIQSELNLAYGADARHRLDVYYPTNTVDSTTNRALFFYVHGGGFTSGDKSAGTTMCKEMARRGYVAVTINYRLSLSADAAAIEKAVADAKAAVAFLMANQASSGYKFNTEYIALHGTSAGGLTIIDMCYQDPVFGSWPYPLWSEKSRVFATAPDCGGDGTMGQLTPRITTAYAPPGMLIHNTQDSTVPYAGTLSLANVLSNKGIYYSVYNPPGGHCSTGWAMYSPIMVKFYYKMLHKIYAQRNGFTRMEAETFDEKTATLQVASCPDFPEGGQCVTNFTGASEYVAFYNVDCNKNASRLLVRLSTPASFSSGTLELRIGRPDGALMGTVTVSGTGGLTVYGTQSAVVTNIATTKGALMGVHDLYLVSKTAGINLNWVTLSTLAVNIQPSITTQPTNAVVDPGQTAAFSVAASGTPTIVLQWQKSTDAGTTWSSIAGATSAAYTTGPAVVNDNGTLFRCVASSFAGDAGSDAAMLIYRPWQDWQLTYFVTTSDPDADVDANPDEDGFINFEEFIADTNPTNGNDFLRIMEISGASSRVLTFESSSSRTYTLRGCTNLPDGIWTNVPGAGPRMGTGGMDSMTDTNQSPMLIFYRLKVELP